MLRFDSPFLDRPMSRVEKITIFHVQLQLLDGEKPPVLGEDLTILVRSRYVLHFLLLNHTNHSYPQVS